MKKYINFINESLTRKQQSYIDMISNYIKNNADFDIYEYDEEFEVHKHDGSGLLSGKLFLMEDDKAVRFNFDKERLSSIDLWNKFEFNVQTVTNKPDFTMEIPGSIVNILDDIVDFINGDFHVNEAKKEPVVKVSSEEDVQLKSIKINKSVFDQDIDVFESIKLFTAQVAYKVSNGLVISGLGGLGKCLGKGTKVIMFDGKLKNVEDILPGEKIMGPDSKPRNIIGINSGVSNLYEIKQNKGMNYIVNDEHILSLKKSDYIKKTKHFKEYGDIVNIPIKEYIEQTDLFKTYFYGYKVEINFDEKQIPFDPYYLGLWLGDGTSVDTSISSIDLEVENYLNQYTNSIGMLCKKYIYTDKNGKEKCPRLKIISENYNKKDTYYTNPLYRNMKNLNLIDNKHIPDLFLYNCKNNRLELLAGLIDSDGFIQSVRGKGCGYSIILKSEKLINQVKFLSDSLGFKTSLKSIKKQIKKNNFEGDYFRLNINGNVDIIPVKIERKKLELNSRCDHKITGIKIDELGIGEYYGFEIDGDHLFLLEDCTVTHNTTEVENTLEEVRAEYVKYAGDASTAGLFEALFINRHKLILFDDIDSIFDEKIAVNLLKAVLDTKPKREVSRMIKTHFDSEGMTDQEIWDKYVQTKKLPKKFIFDGRIIFITNKPGDSLDEAFMTRCLFVDVDPDTDQIINRIYKIMPKVLPNVPEAKKLSTIEFMLMLYEKYSTKFPLNLRTFVHCLNIRIANEFMIQVGGESVLAWQMLTKQYLVKK